jgi:small subunit ribosomal protein S9
MVVKKITKKSAPVSEVKKIVIEPTPEKIGYSGKYFEAVGRRKTATARVRIFPNSKVKGITVNGRKIFEYFKDKEYRDVLTLPFTKLGMEVMAMSIQVSGGGTNAQAFAVRHGLSRALVLTNPENRSVLKTLGLLTRDSRRRERKKPGLKGARRRPQWSKR